MKLKSKLTKYRIVSLTVLALQTGLLGCYRTQTKCAGIKNPKFSNGQFVKIFLKENMVTGMIMQSSLRINNRHEQEFFYRILFGELDDGTEDVYMFHEDLLTHIKEN